MIRLVLFLLVCEISHAFVSSKGLGWGPFTHTSTARSATVEETNTNESSNTNEEATAAGVVDETNLKTADILSLNSIRSTLIRQEETIIFALIERAQFRHNSKVYQNGGFGDLGAPLGSVVTNDDEDLENSFLDYMLIGTEILHSGVRRYTSPEEHAFFPHRIPGSIQALPTLDYPTNLLSNIQNASSINFNPILLQKYKEWIVPSIAQDGDDEQHGSSVLADIAVLQALSRRVHYGKFVAESKYLSDPEGYQTLVNNNDADGVMKLLTNEVVEEKVLRRARLKAATYGREPLMTSLPDSIECSDTQSIVAAAAASAVSAAFESLDEYNKNNNKSNGDTSSVGAGTKINPATIEDIYRNFIIPLTKDIEVAYLFLRCGKVPPPEYAPDRMSVDLTK